MKQVYIANTPYHLLLSCGLATQSQTSDKKYLIIIPNYSGVGVFYKSLTEWHNNPFSKIIIANEIHDVACKLKRVHMIRTNLRLLKKFFEEEINELCEVYTFDDQFPESQLLAYMNYNKGGSNIYAEHGNAPYNSYMRPNLPYYKKILYKFIYGIWYQDVNVIGTYGYIDKIMVFYPELVRSELKGKTIIEISKGVFKTLKNTDLISILLESYNFKQEDSNPNYILIIPHSSFLSEESLNTYLTLIEYFVNFFGIGWAKYHPREPKGDYLGLNNYSSHLKLIPHSLPLEAVFAVLQDEMEPKIVIGDFSTSLLTAKRLLDDTYVISIMKLIGLVDTNIENAFKQIDVLLPSNIEDLRSLLMTIENEDIQLKDFDRLQT